ncbi:disulfide bond formation protein B [uncultured Lamprocystis sp.]|jgi:disulfide bond formation protein DsbB|uniref:disulfide bond formation protein B n=1 Tax=uncultured Lamprocystis sp. TaxID=543132 RepID=UPI0025CD83A0|nr:disulfide bond formation protein B [uncultured Lamprocystis sp.]
MITTVPPRVVWLVTAAAAAAAVLASLVLTAWLALAPCHLCIFQRLLFMLIAGLGLLAALTRGLVQGLAGGLIALAAVAGAASAGYQSWLQEQPPDSISCIGGQPGLIERLVEWLGQQAPALFLATGFCEEKELLILGLSLANWALLCFFLALAAAWWALRRGAGLDQDPGQLGSPGA